MLVVAGVCVLASVLSLARLAPRHRRAFPAAVALAGLLGAMIIAGIWGEWPTTWYPRLLGVVAVLLAAVTLAVPILHRASRVELGRPAPLHAGIRFCPSCGSPVIRVAGVEAACSGCGARFRVRFLGGRGPATGPKGP